MNLKPVLILLLAVYSLTPPVSGRQVRVHPGPEAIRKAIESAQAGDTLYIQPGVYAEHDIRVNKKLAIIGVDFPVIDGEHKSQIIFIMADSVTVQGLQVQNTGRSSMTDMAAVRIQNARHVTVRNNRLHNNTYGVYLQNAAYCTVQQNRIHSNSIDELNSGNGIHAWKSEHLQISGNHISGHRDGIYFEFVTESEISRNVATKNVRYGLHFMFSHNDTYTENQFTDNGSGVAVMYSKGVTMLRNTFRHNRGDASYAILLKEISDSRIMQNLFIRNTVGLYMEGTSRIGVKQNRFTDNGWAVKIMASCDDNSFEENNFLGNSFDIATNGTMMLNRFRNNYWDKYDGYDMNKDGVGDVPYYPVSVYAVITERIPAAMILYRSFLTNIMEQVEKVMPSVIPDKLRDDTPLMKKLKL